jgi:N-acetylneuraminic acid mutarotase
MAPERPVPLLAHAACVEQGRIWVTGGANDDDARVFVSWAPPETRWRDEGQLPIQGVFHGMCALDGWLYVVGGLPESSQAWRYDLASRTWERIGDLPTPRSRMRAVESGGMIYVIGGYVAGTANDGNTGACEAYDPLTNAWKARTPMPTPRHGHTVVALGRRLVVTGGGSGESARAEVYDPSTDTWTKFSACPRVYAPESRPDPARGPFNLLFHEAVAWGGRILHFGAREHEPIPVVAWDPGLDAWEIVSERGPTRHRLASARIGTTLYLIGGENSAREGPHVLRDTLAVDLRAFGSDTR